MVSKPKSSGHTKGVALMYRGGETFVCVSLHSLHSLLSLQTEEKDINKYVPSFLL